MASKKTKKPFWSQEINLKFLSTEKSDGRNEAITNVAAQGEETDWGSIYSIGAFISGIIGAIGIWIYSFDQWGLLFGLLFGWIPAIIGGVVIGFAWPLIAIVLIWALLQS